MEVWKLIILVVTSIWTVSIFFREKYTVGSLETGGYTVCVSISLAIICSYIDWSWLSIKI